MFFRQPNSPLITIIIPTYNCDDFIDQALWSVVNQTYQSYELIIVDGRSTDKTLDIIDRYKKDISVLVSEPDSGIYDAMNKGVNMAKGDWLYFLGADDILINCLHKVALNLRSTKTIYYGDVYLPEKNKTYSGKFNWYTLVSKNINHQSIFYPRQAFEHYQFDLLYPILSDYDLNLRLWGEGKYKFKYINELIAIHNETGVSSQKVDEIFQVNKPRLIAKYFGNRIAMRNKMNSIRRSIKEILP